MRAARRQRRAAVLVLVLQCGECGRSGVWLHTRENLLNKAAYKPVLQK